MGPSSAQDAAVKDAKTQADSTQADAAADATSVDVFDVGSMTVPAEFKRVEPKSRIIQHEFAVTDAAVDRPARLTMMAAGGDIKANINRWKGQFSGGDDDSGKVEAKEIEDVTIHMVDINGSYADSMGGGPFSGGKKIQRKNYAMAGAIIETKAGRKYFVKMVGPKPVVDANRKRFETMVMSVAK